MSRTVASDVPAYRGGRIIVERSVVDHECGGTQSEESHWRSSYNQFSDHTRDAESVA